MAILRFVVGPDYAGEKVDTFLRKEARVSGTVLKRAKRIPLGITMDGVHIRTIDTVLVGATLCIDTCEEEKSYHKCNIEVPIVYQDDDLIVYNKISNMPSHPSSGHISDTLANVFAAGETTKGLTYRPINRLDKDTTGLVFVGKNRYAAHFYAKRIQKRYLALVTGCVASNTDTIVGAIERETVGSMRRMVRADGQESITQYTVRERLAGFTVVELLLQTGRTHQIRVHMSHIGHPLLGDELYGGAVDLISRQALHCAEGTVLLSSGKEITLYAPLPLDMSQLIITKQKRELTQ